MRSEPGPFLEKIPMPEFPIRHGQLNLEGANRQLFDPHRHRHLEFLHIRHGKARFQLGAGAVIGEPGDLIAINSNQIHGGVSLADRTACDIVTVDPLLLLGRGADAADRAYVEPLLEGVVRYASRWNAASRPAACLRELVSVLERRPHGYALLVKSKLFELLAALLADGSPAGCPETPAIWSGAQLNNLSGVLDHMHEHYRERLNIDRLAKLAGYSRAYFSRLFKAVMNRTLVEYHLLIRLATSEHYLLHTAMSVTEIAAETGFCDVYHFSRMFKKYRRVTPSELRRGACEVKNEV